jgi:hypothetical protein
LQLAIHARAWTEGLNYYPALKFISHTYFVIILAVGAMLLASARWWRLGGVSLCAVWLAAAAWATWAAPSNSPDETLSFCRLKEAVAAHAGGRPVVVLTTRLEPFLLMNMVSGATGVPLVALTTDQELSIPVWGLCWRSRLDDQSASGNGCSGLALIDPEVLANGGFQLGKSTGPRIECQRVLAHAGRMLLCEAIVHTPAGVSFSGGYWITPQTNTVQEFVATSNRLTVTGTVLEYLPFPYRCTCRTAGSDWIGEIIVAQPGFFEMTLELPAELVNRPIALEFVDVPTFRPCDVPGGATDMGEYGFTLWSVKVECPQ